MEASEIIGLLPYQRPFLFVDDIGPITDNSIEGHYTFREDEFFYIGHFKDNPVTPGVILTECMAQIGLVCFGIYLMKDESTHLQSPQIALTAHQMDFYLPVLPGQKVKVHAEKEVFRFNKLKCYVKMMDGNGQLIARGRISGILKGITAP